MHDFRYGLRMLARTPSFTVIAVLTLALGIGLNTAIFTIFNAVALKPLPVRDSGSLMRIERWFASGLIGDSQYLFSWQEYQYLKARGHSLPGLIAVSNRFTVGGLLPSYDGSTARGPVRLSAEMVSPNYFSELMEAPARGRTFTEEENRVPGAHPVVVVSYGFWQRALGADSGVLGEVLRVNGVAFTIVGVAAKDFAGTANPPVTPDFWAPLMMEEQLLPGRHLLEDAHARDLQLLGHEVQLAAPPRGASELSTLLQQFQTAHPDPHLAPNAPPSTTGLSVTTRVSLQRATLFGNTEDVRFRLIVAALMTLVGLVLLIACANLANMLLARATSRRREIGVRMALGASRLRLIRQLLIESVTLAIIGGAAGLVVSIWASALAWSAVTPFLNDVAFAIPTAPDARVLMYALLVSVLTGIVFGLAPALNASRADIFNSLKDSGALFSGHVKRSSIRTLLVGGQVAASLVLLVAAGLLARGLMRSQSADPGYATAPVYVLPLAFGRDDAQANARAHQAMDRLQTLPSIEGLAVVERPPMMWTWTVDMRSPDAAAAPGAALANHVSASYFGSMGIPLVRGRTFNRSEEQFGGAVTVISEATARALWPSQDPIGRTIDFHLARDGAWQRFEVVGIAGDVRTGSLSRLDPAMVYFPAPDRDLSTFWLLMRIRGDAPSALAAIGSALAPYDARVASGFSPVNLERDVVRAQRTISRTLSLSAATLALLALVLAAAGIYGVASFMVSQREHEIGIRIALGATSRDVSGLMVLDSLRPVAYGALAGLAGSFAVSAVLKAVLAAPASVDPMYGVGAFDPWTFAGLPAFLALVALAASWIPARRALRVDPIAALRAD